MIFHTSKDTQRCPDHVAPAHAVPTYVVPHLFSLRHAVPAYVVIV